VAVSDVRFFNRPWGSRGWAGIVGLVMGLELTCVRTWMWLCACVCLGLQRDGGKGEEDDEEEEELASLPPHKRATVSEPA
jgi:hypothetical protein